MKKSIQHFLILLAFVLLTIPFCVNGSDYNESYEGDYSIDYLTRNFQMITFGIHDTYNANLLDISKGDLVGIPYMEGPVLVNGNFYTGNETHFANGDDNYISYVSGEIGDNVYTDSLVATSRNFVDFEKMYVQVVNEQKLLVEKAVI